MISYILFLFLALFLLPLILSIAAVTQAGKLRRDFDEFKARQPKPSLPPVPSATTPVEVAAQKPAPTPPPPTSTPLLAPKPDVPPPIPAPLPHTAQGSAAATEVALGGRVASFVGIGLLLIGVAFMVGYAITHGWLGPGARIVLGMLGGAGLVGLGHLAEKRDPERLHILARTLTGGGAAIFYLCVYAAHALYGFIDVSSASVGLVLCAALTLRLAVMYRSEVVAVIGVIGAFAMPLLIDDPSNPQTFLMSYLAIVNIPVLLLGLRRHWQTLYNTAFGFTAFYVAAVAVQPRGSAWIHLTFLLIYFLQFAGLGLLKLRDEKQATGRAPDIIRLTLNSLLLLWALHTHLEYWALNDWMGLAFVALALVHAGLARAAWIWKPAFREELLTWVIGAVTFVTFALPAQFSGVWISLGWAVEGVVLCYIALRYGVPLLRPIAFGVGAFGLMKVMIHDITLYETAPAMFLNARFLVGLAAALLLGAQGHLHARWLARNPDGANKASPLYAWTGVVIWILFVSDAFWTMGSDNAWTWLLTSGALLVIAATCAGLARAQPAYGAVALVLFVLVPLKLLVDLWATWQLCPVPDHLFLNSPFLMLLLFAFITVVFARMLFEQEPFASRWAATDYPKWIHIGSLVAGILVVSLELYRIPGTWNQALITLWWAGCAITLVVWGLFRRTAIHRYAGLALFGATTLKVVLLDILELDGLARIAAFMATGALLLVLSYLYQRASTRLLSGS